MTDLNKYYCDPTSGVFVPNVVTKENQITVAYFGYDTYDKLEECEEKCKVLNLLNPKEELYKYFNQ